jgi:hypothetical protein
MASQELFPRDEQDDEEFDDESLVSTSKSATTNSRSKKTSQRTTSSQTTSKRTSQRTTASKNARNRPADNDDEEEHNDDDEDEYDERKQPKRGVAMDDDDDETLVPTRKHRKPSTRSKKTTTTTHDETVQESNKFQSPIKTQFVAHSQQVSQKKSNDRHYTEEEKKRSLINVAFDSLTSPQLDTKNYTTKIHRITIACDTSGSRITRFAADVGCLQSAERIDTKESRNVVHRCHHQQ